MGRPKQQGSGQKKKKTIRNTSRSELILAEGKHNDTLLPSGSSMER